jgi:hypothetical protein
MNRLSESIEVTRVEIDDGRRKLGDRSSDVDISQFEVRQVQLSVISDDEFCDITRHRIDVYLKRRGEAQGIDALVGGKEFEDPSLAKQKLALVRLAANMLGSFGATWEAAA